VEVDLSKKATSTEWIIGNIQHAGFYRVNYDQENWKMLIKQLNEDHKLIERINRAELIDDAFNLGKAELIEQTVFFDVINYLTKEEDDLPFIPAFYGLNVIADLLVENYQTYKLFQDYYKDLLEAVYKRIEWNNQDDPNKL
jgi:aminopeptidase N